MKNESPVKCDVNAVKELIEKIDEIETVVAVIIKLAPHEIDQIIRFLKQELKTIHHERKPLIEIIEILNTIKTNNLQDIAELEEEQKIRRILVKYIENYADLPFTQRKYNAEKLKTSLVLDVILLNQKIEAIWKRFQFLDKKFKKYFQLYENVLEVTVGSICNMM